MPGRVQQGLTVKDLYGGRFLTPELAQRSMAEWEQRQKREFKERIRGRICCGKCPT